MVVLDEDPISWEEVQLALRGGKPVKLSRFGWLRGDLQNGTFVSTLPSELVEIAAVCTLVYFRRLRAR